MNQSFIIFLLIILIIGILYYYLRKEDFLNPQGCLNAELNFNTVDKSKPYNQIFSNIYNNLIILNDPQKYRTFMNKDFTEVIHQKAIASFLGLRDGIIIGADKPYQNHIIRHKMTVLFNSNVDKYLEITFNNLDNIPFVKIIYNNTKLQCIIENKLPDYQNTPLLLSNVSDKNELILPNGFGNKIEFVTTTLQREGVIYNQFSIIIDGNMYCYNLPSIIENHFYNILKNITIYTSNTNTNNTFTISHMCSGEIYASYADSKIKSQRFPQNSDNYTIRGTNWDAPFNLLRPNVPSGYYPIGSYFISNLGDKNDKEIAPLILKEGDYVQPSTTYSNKWDNDGNKGKGSKRGAHYQFTLLNANDRTINVSGTDYTFRALGGSVILNKPANSSIGEPVALIREDCLEKHPDSIHRLWNDKGSGARRDGSIWTYNLRSFDNYGRPGQNLAIFQEGHNTAPSDKKWIIKDSCLVPQPQELTKDEKTLIDTYVTNNINKYLELLKNLKLSKDSIINPNITQMNDSTRFKTEINTMINNSKSLYDSTREANKNTDDMQNQYNKHYDFINLLKNEITPIKTKESILYNDYSPKINEIISGINSNKLSEPVNQFKEIDNNFITKSKYTSDLVQQYNLQRESEKILQFLGEQVSK
jgi:hypothetical protein